VIVGASSCMRQALLERISPSGFDLAEGRFTTMILLGWAKFALLTKSITLL
jgi:hypothetical protein